MTCKREEVLTCDFFSFIFKDCQPLRCSLLQCLYYLNDCCLLLRFAEDLVQMSRRLGCHNPLLWNRDYLKLDFVPHFDYPAVADSFRS